MSILKFEDYQMLQNMMYFGRPPKGLRRGQWIMNKLGELNPEIYNEVTGKEFDPFYDDSRLRNFFRELLEYTDIEPEILTVEI